MPDTDSTIALETEQLLARLGQMAAKLNAQFTPDSVKVRAFVEAEAKRRARHGAAEQTRAAE